MKRETLPFIVDARVNGIQFTQALVDSGCRCYATVNEALVQSLDLPRIKIQSRILDGVVPN